ncbi:MAG: flagellar protein FliS [Bacteroidetes bacterium]|nr:flagellar protein FliS [Bacteroidota bacterium]
METLAHTPRQAFKGYKTNEIMSLSPVQLILKLYDFVIVNSKRKNYNNVSAGLTQLIAALNFDYQEVSIGFFRLYRYCQNQSQNGNFAEVEKIISELRSAWAQAFKLV